MSPVADWYLGQIIIHGWLTVITAETLLLLAVWCGIRAALNAQARHARKEKP